MDKRKMLEQIQILKFQMHEIYDVIEKTQDTIYLLEEAVLDEKEKELAEGWRKICV